jgi:DNA repair protein RadD
MCPTCRALVAVYEPTCPDCHYEWPPKPARHEARAQHVAILSTEVIEPKWLDVSGVRYAIHTKPGSPDSMRVEYSTGFQTSRQWICFAHSGRARGNAGIWWRQLGGELPVPATAQEGIDRAEELRVVVGIQLKSTGPYPEIVGHRLAPEGADLGDYAVNRPINDADIPF